MYLNVDKLMFQLTLFASCMDLVLEVWKDLRLCNVVELQTTAL